MLKVNSQTINDNKTNIYNAFVVLVLTTIANSSRNTTQQPETLLNKDGSIHSMTAQRPEKKFKTMRACPK